MPETFTNILIICLLSFISKVYCQCISFEALVTNVTCFGGSDGSIAISISSDNGPYKYQWAPINSTSESIAGLMAGTYSISITSKDNCSLSRLFYVYQPPELVLSWESNPISCDNRNDGTLSASAIGGVSPYKFRINSGQESPLGTSFVFSQLPFTAPSIPSITVFHDGLTPEFDDWSWAKNYSLSYRGSSHSGSFSISYYPSFFDAVYFHCNWCIDLNIHAGLSFWVNGLSGGQMLQITMDTVTQTYGFVNIFGPDDQFATIPPYSWVECFFNFSLLRVPAGVNLLAGLRFQDLSGLPPTTSSKLLIDDVIIVPKIDFSKTAFVEVVDSKGCSNRKPYVVNVSPAMNVSIFKSNPACYGHDATLYASVANGKRPLSYNWIPSYQNRISANVKGTVTYLSEIIYDDRLQNFHDLSDSSIVYDNSFYFRGNESIKYFPSRVASLLWLKESPIDTEKYLGIEFWIYLNTTVTSISFAVGSYSSTTNDPLSFYPFTFRELSNVSSVPLRQWVKAFYSFSVLQTDYNYNGIMIKSYTDDTEGGSMFIDEVKFILATNKEYDLNRVDYYKVEIFDSSLCSTKLDYISVPEPSKLTVDVVTSFVTCSNLNNGKLLATPNGGTPPYSYNWTLSSKINSRSPSLSNLQPSTGFVEVADSHFCTTASQQFTIVQPPPIWYDFVSKPATCNGRKDGKIILTAQGGTPPFSFIVSGFSSSFVNLLPVYVFSDKLSEPFYNSSQVTRSGNLQDTSIVAQSGYYSISFIPNKNENISFSCNECISSHEYLGITFWVNLAETSKMPQIQFGLSSNGQTTNSIDYIFNATHINNWVEVKYNFNLETESSWETFYIAGASDSAESRIYVDSVALIPRWFSTKPMYSSIPSGFFASFIGAPAKYEIKLLDSNGCPAIIPVEIVEPQKLEIIVLKTIEPTVKSAKDGQIQIHALGGTPPYEYKWDEHLFGPHVDSLDVGTYNVIVRDSNGCTANQTIVLTTEYDLIEQNVTLTAILAVIVAICLLLDIFAIAMIIAKPDFYLGKSPLFCKIIHAGVLLAHIAVAGLLARPSNTFCVVFPWLLGFSFVLVYGCLFLKTWRLFWIMRASQKLQKINLSNLYICKLLAIYSSIEIVYLIIWTIIDPQKVILKEVSENERYYTCSSVNPSLYWAIFLGYKCIWFLFGVAMAIGSRNMIKRYNESKQVYYCIYNITVVAIICMPLVFVMQDIPHATVVIQFSSLVIMVTFTLVALYFGVWMKILTGDNRPSFVPNVHLSETSSRSAVHSANEPSRGTSLELKTSTLTSGSL